MRHLDFRARQQYKKTNVVLLDAVFPPSLSVLSSAISIFMPGIFRANKSNGSEAQGASGSLSREPRRRGFTPSWVGT